MLFLNRKTSLPLYDFCASHVHVTSGDAPNELDLLSSAGCFPFSKVTVVRTAVLLIEHRAERCLNSSIVPPTQSCGRLSVPTVSFIELGLIVDLHYGAVDDPHVRPDPLRCKSTMVQLATLKPKEPAVSAQGLTSIAVGPQRKHRSPLIRSEPSRKLS